MFTLMDMNETAELHEKTDLKASNEALEFLSSIEPKDVDQCLFVDSMVTVSDTGRELGEFCVSVQKASYNEEPCYLVHANSHGTIDNIPCGTSITAYLSRSLATLEENHDEYMKLQEHTLEKKLHIMRQGSHLIVNTIITEKDEVKKQAFTFPLHSLQGFLSEASNLVILRILAKRKKVPENLTFLSFDTNTQIGVSTYRELDVKKQVIGTEVMEVFGIERTVSSAEKIPAKWHCYFLPDGHLVSRVQVGSSVTMNLLQLPLIVSEGLYIGLLLSTDYVCIRNTFLMFSVVHLFFNCNVLLCLFLDERDRKSGCEKKPLVWEEDIELYSKFLDRKEELKADHSTYVRQHPELKALLADFLQMLLLRKPQDVLSFAHDFFIPFDSQRPAENTVITSQNITAEQDKS
ncbi:ciliogenesis-associated TTC17-interacting protein isoform X1 [Tachysurus fulvidraco]|uniref:ciliogenesis-associated TTC17-interacting protein isoform X1 n=1 Tax=Tachysurus fulvidraco TaxID=1234273 RepID=UPI001FEDF19C|nr:ciliogenesis-associated TTC17-interacting protein isoform X1 [Tachysurus fulvidraco]